MSKIEPALTAKEWAAFGERAERTSDQLGWACGEVWSSIDNVDRHGLAALALHGQEFGFTRAHLEALAAGIACVGDRLDFDTEQGLSEIFDRIAALLPPEGK